jgi:asparagine synthase (glutamine-hydrolysing)
VAEALGTEHLELVVEPDCLLDALDDLVEIVAEPFADSSIIPTHHIAKLTRPHVKVALSGDGGD